MRTKLFITLAIVSLFFACKETKTKDNNFVKIKGQITNPIGNSVKFICEDTVFETTVNNDGVFEISFKLDSGTYMSFGHGLETTSMYVLPSDDIELSIDTKEFDETISYKGSKASSFLAKKLLIQEQNNLAGKEFYLGSADEYKSFLDKYKKNLTDELKEVGDSFFMKKEISDIERTIAFYISKQSRIEGLEEDVRLFMMQSRELSKDYPLYSLLDSLKSEDFFNVLDEYSAKNKELLSKVTDKDFVKKEKERIEKTNTFWKEKKTALDNMPKIGEPAIDFTYPDKDGNEVSLLSFKGKLVYVDVWATWCKPCLAETPELQKLESEYHGKNIVFMSVSVDETREPWIKMVEEREFGGVQLWAKGWSKITKDYAIFGIPRFMLFSADGKIISTDAPRPSSDEIRGLLNDNL